MSFSIALMLNFKIASFRQFIMSLSRRNFIGVAGAGLLAGCTETTTPPSVATDAPRLSPLDGVGRENLKITDVRVRLFSCDYPIEKWWYGAGVTILTEVVTDQGIIGIGGPSPYGGPEFVKEYTEKHIKPQILGKNPFDVEIIAPSHRTTNKAMAWAGINVACWDIIGKVKNKPVYELLATNTEPVKRIKHYASCGTIWDFDKRPEDLIDEALAYREEGFYGFKFRFAEHFEKNMTIAKYLPFLEKLREAVGDDFDLIHEFNMRIPVDQAIDLVPKLAELKFQWVEETGRPLGQAPPRGGRRPAKCRQGDRLALAGAGGSRQHANLRWRNDDRSFRVQRLDRKRCLRHRAARL